MFSEVKNLVQQRYNQLAKGEQHIFYKNVDREKVYELYLSGFENDVIRQSNNCNCCKSFLRQFSGICFIDKNYKSQGLWYFNIGGIEEEYENSISLVNDYIESLPITDVFLPESRIVGTPKNFDPEKKIYWQHFSLELGNVPLTAAKDRDSKAGILRTGKQTLKRALDEFTIDSLETMIELTKQGSLYRGAEFVEMVKAFLLLKRSYDQLTTGKDEFVWINSLKTPYLNNIRGSVIGTFLEDLSVGIEIDDALPRYEKKVAPTNYKRPTAAITPRMIEEAKKKIEELGYLESLDRRFAVSTDISVNDIVFTDRSTEVSDIFGDLQKTSLVNPKTLSKVEEITIEKFLTEVVPTAKTIELLLEQPHFSNLISLITAVNPKSPSMFKWDNPFSWSYVGGIADSMKERVKSAGGDVSGVLRFSIQWNDEDTKGTPDFDAHAIEPNGTEIYYSSYKGISKSSMSGNLDVDMRGHSNEPEVRVENITWSNINMMKDGNYKLSIVNYNGLMNTGFKAQVEFNGEIYNFHHNTRVLGRMDIAVVNLNQGVFTIKPSLPTNSNISSKEKWGVKTNIFTKVKSIMLSPNHWENTLKTGNKHFIFILEGAVNNEEVRPFYNEFLNNKLNENRKVLEVMASKLKVLFSEQQLSGVGFSETQQNTIIARVSGSFKRNLKINF